MVAHLKEDYTGRQERLDFALSTLQHADFQKLQKKLANSRTTWLLAGLVDGLAGSFPVPPCPADFTVLATDGSHIDVDRHQTARCYLINIGTVLLKYGAAPDAELASYPRLYSGDTDMAIKSSGTKDRDQAIEGTLLGIKRSVDECAYLATIGRSQPAGSINLALMDGSLILWGLAGKDYPDFVVEAMLDKGMLEHLAAMKSLNEDRKFALASYISFPRGSDVVNVLRVAVCPRDVIDTDKTCTDCKSRECDKITGIQDRDLFAASLKPGERSSLFISTSSIVKKYGDEHLIHFFYVKSDEEIARVEIPAWVAGNRELLELTHSLILDQCRRGQGYPVSLSEAHEQAVVTGADRENFWQLVELSLVEEHMPTSGSAKSQSKKTRWI